jgi:hypothetical protein
MIVAVDSFLEQKREVLRLSGGFAVVRNDDSAGRPPSQAISLFFTSIGGQDYPFFMRRSVDSTLHGGALVVQSEKVNSYNFIIRNPFRIKKNCAAVSSLRSSRTSMSECNPLFSRCIDFWRKITAP